MTTIIPEPSHVKRDPGQLVEMAWDPITRIVGSLGIYTKIDFENREVVECHSTSSIFRGYSIFMKGKDPRDAHFITSRICGICGDNHATCSCYCQNMAYGVKPPHLGEWLINLGEAAEYMFDHNIFQENLVGVDYCEKMVVRDQSECAGQGREHPGAARRHARLSNDRRHHAGAQSVHRRVLPGGAAGQPVDARDVLPHGRQACPPVHAVPGRHRHHRHHPADDRLHDPADALCRVHEDRSCRCTTTSSTSSTKRCPATTRSVCAARCSGCWGSFQDPEVCNFAYKDMERWGDAMFVTPGVVIDGKLHTHSLVDINLGIRILLGHSYYDDWTDQEMFVKNDPLGNPVDRRHPWNQHTNPRPQKRDFDGELQLGDVAAVVRRQGPLGAGHRRRPARPTVVDRAGRPGRHRLREGHRQQRADQPAEDRAQGPGFVRVEGAAVRQQHDRAQPRPHVLPGLRRGVRAAFRREGACRDPRGPHQDLGEVRRSPTRASAAGSPRRCAGC